MKTSLLALSLLTLSMATACGRRDDPDDAPTPEAASADTAPMPATDPAMAAPADPTPAATPSTDDALALGLLAAVDQHEIEAAQQATAMKVSAPVLAYAQMMEKEHGDNLAETKMLGALGDTPEVQAMKDKGASDLAELGKKSGKEYETAYVEAMVKGHTEALALIDGRLLTLASPGPVREHLTKTRDQVATHLEAAQKLQAAPQS